MTCIVAIVENGTTYFGADSWVGNVPSYRHENVSQTIRKEPKIFRKNDMLVGMNGNTRVIQVVKYLFDSPEYKHGTSKLEYLVKYFIVELKKALEKNDCEKIDLEGDMLLSIENELFTMGEDFRICDTAYPYDAIGKARYVAVGSLDTTAQLELSPVQRIDLALQACQRHTCVVEPPYIYLTSEMEEPEVIAPYGKKAMDI